MKTLKSKNILIALDYDKTALIVAQAGFALSIAMEAKVTLLHVMSDPVFYSSARYATIKCLNEIAEIDPLHFKKDERLKVVSQHFLDTMKNYLGDSSIQTLLVEGDFAETILTKTKDLNIDIVVMGSHSHRWIEALILGSATAKVIQKTSVPVYIVPTEKHD